MVWCFVRYFLPTPSGRKRFNLLGAVDALTKELITVVNETTVTAETVCELLSKRAAHVGEGGITVVLDNIFPNKRFIYTAGSRVTDTASG